MLLVGSDDGVYELTGIESGGETARDVTAEQRLDGGRVLRVATFEGIDGVFAASPDGLSHSTDGEDWTDLAVPETEVYAVGASRYGDRLYAGTRPAHVFVTDAPKTPGEWVDCEGFQELPSREDWGLERHDYVSQVRDVHADPADDERVVAGVEVAGVHLSEDGGETWTERKEGVNDDVHELHVVTTGEYVAATGYGLFHTDDAGRSWRRIDEGVDQRYFRTAHSHEGVVYAGAALANSTTWDDPDADPRLFAYAGEGLEPVDIPTPDETVTGITSVGDALVLGTHRGSLLVDLGDGFEMVGSFPVAEEPRGRYTPLCWFEG